MQLSNKQLKLLLPVVKRELEADPHNMEWRDLHERLIKQVGWRISKPGGQELQELLRDDFRPPPPQVWGRDYE
jgi:hypothetical protein